MSAQNCSTTGGEWLWRRREHMKNKQRRRKSVCIRISQCSNQAAASRNWDSIPERAKILSCVTLPPV